MTKKEKTDEEKTKDIYDFIKGTLAIMGSKVSIGTGFSLTKLKAAPYLKVVLFDTKLFDIGPFISSIGDLGLSAGLNISQKDSKAKIILDAGIVTDLKDILDGAKLKFGLHGGIRLTF